MESSESSESSSQEDETAVLSECIRIAIFNCDITAVLMVTSDSVSENWDLPYFEYTDSPRQYHFIERSCIDFKNWLLEPHQKTYFTAFAELLGHMKVPSRFKKDEIGFATLCVVEGHSPEQEIFFPDSLHLPIGAAWKDLRFVQSLKQSLSYDNVLRKCLETLIHYQTRVTSMPSQMPDPRYRPGWFRSATALLRSIISADGEDPCGNVIQQHLSFTSTLLKSNSTSGWYFLKAPAVGTGETVITAKLSEWFPDSVPVVLQTSPELGCFVSREFPDFSLDIADIPDLVDTIGTIHLKCVNAVDELKNMGCPVRTVRGLERKLASWANGEDALQFSGEALQQIQLLAPTFQNMCDRLDAFDIPLTLLHGDLALSNATRQHGGRENVILFDWEFGCISHPFFDFHRIDKDTDSHIMDAYLERWDPFFDFETARAAYKIGSKLGWLLKIWTISDCLAACSVQVLPRLQKWADDIVNVLFENERNNYMRPYRGDGR